MTDKEFEELKTKYTKELERRKRLESALGDIEHIQRYKKDNPSIRVRTRTIGLTEEEKERVCDYIISILKAGLEEWLRKK